MMPNTSLGWLPDTYMVSAIIFAVWLLLVGLRIYFFIRIRRGLKPALLNAALLPWPSSRLTTMRIWWDWLMSLHRWFRNPKQKVGGADMTDSANNMVAGIAQGLAQLAAREPTDHEKELARLRAIVIASDYNGDEAAYLAWAKETFPPSELTTVKHGNEILWLRGKISPAKPTEDWLWRAT
jgi:hypothetical protein